MSQTSLFLQQYRILLLQRCFSKRTNLNDTVNLKVCTAADNTQNFPLNTLIFVHGFRYFCQFACSKLGFRDAALSPLLPLDR